MVLIHIKAYIIFLIKKQQEECPLFLFKFMDGREAWKDGIYPFAINGGYGTSSIKEWKGALK